MTLKETLADYCKAPAFKDHEDLINPYMLNENEIKECLKKKP